MQLKYYVTARDGKQYGIYNELDDGRRTTRYFGPFESEDETKAECHLFQKAYGYSYGGTAKPVLIEEKWYSYQDRWNSRD